MTNKNQSNPVYQALSREQAEMIINMVRCGVDFGETSWPIRAMEALKMQANMESSTIRRFELNGENAMRRDMDLVRRLLLTIEAKEDLEAEVIRYDDVDELVLDRHMLALYEAGFLMGLKRELLSLDCAQIMVQDLTWEGHDFLAVLRNEEVMEKLKEALSVEQFIQAPLSVIKEVGSQVLKSWMLKKLGLDED